MALLCEGSENTLIPAFPIMQISSNLVMNHIFQLLKVIPHRDTNVFTGWAALGYTSKLHSCAKPVEKLSFLISNILFLVAMVRYLFLLRLLVGFHLLHFSPPPLAAGVATPLTSFSPSLWKSKSWENTQRKWATSCSEESNSTLFLQEKRQGQTAEFEINQTLALSTGATFRLWLRFDLGSSFQWVLTSQSCEESRAGSLQRGF